MNFSLFTRKPNSGENDAVEQEWEQAHDEVMWGKPARDIITGIGNNGGVRPVRAIWELVQNARDMVSSGKRAQIEFTRKQDELIFQHDGLPFTPSTIEALIMQTSSKDKANSVQVGQYGTGFLTTHLFGLEFYLTAPLLVSSEFQTYYKINDFRINRSSTDKQEMIKMLKAQWKETQKWRKDSSKISREPFPHTIFTYKHEGERARQNAANAFQDAPEMAPYVLALNTSIGSISFIDEVDDSRSDYSTESGNPELFATLPDGNVYRTIVQYTKHVKDNGPVTKRYSILLIQSAEMTIGEHPLPKVTIVLPLKKDENDENLEVFTFSSKMPHLFIFLPLLGTESWGVNYLYHSPLFTADKDSRDSLRLVGNGQNNDNDAVVNQEVIELGNKLICQFIDATIAELRNAKYLVRDAFKTDQSDEELSKYLKGQQIYWRDKYETLNIVSTDNGDIQVKDCHILDSALYDACLNDSILLDAIYSLMLKAGKWKVPKKADLLYWSDTINRWYKDENANPHIITLDELAKSIPSLSIEEKDLDWLLAFCTYVTTAKNSLMDTNALIPNENLVLKLEKDVLKPDPFDAVVKKVLSEMAPEKVECFVHDKFRELTTYTLYSYEDAKESITNFINKQNSDQRSVLTPIMTSKKHDMENPTARTFSAKTFQEKEMKQSTAESILNLYKALVSDDSESIAARLLPLLIQFYNVQLGEVNKIDKNLYNLELRQLYTTLIYDSLFKFTLSDDSCKASRGLWIKQMVELLYGFQDTKSFLSLFQIYPDQTNSFKYSDWLLKQQEDVPDRMLDIYDTIIGGGESIKSIRHRLVSKDYSDWFVGTGLLDGLAQAKEIESDVAKLNYSITNYKHQKLIVEIIHNILPGKPDSAKWKKLFTELDGHKAEIMLSKIQSPEIKDSIFSIVMVEDVKKLDQLASLINDPDFDLIIKKGKEAIEQKLREENDFEFKKGLGSFVEDILQKELNEVLGENTLETAIPVSNEQGGQDLIIRLNGQPFYYIEVKSRWSTEKSVTMSTMQHHRSCDEKDNYALCAVDMTSFSSQLDMVKEHRYPPFEAIKDCISVLDNIGDLNTRLIDATKNDGSRVHVAGGYEVLVPQAVIQENRKSFDCFLSSLKDRITAALNDER